jgi:hypothetical protein
MQYGLPDQAKQTDTILKKLWNAIKSFARVLFGRDFAVNHLEVISRVRNADYAFGNYDVREDFGKSLYKTDPKAQEAEAQMEAVRKQYESREQWMKAPNGKPTKLNERQWLQARTPAFKEWFGDWLNDPKNASKVVDENGEPMVVYRGRQPSSMRDRGAHAFRDGRSYWTSKKELAEVYASSSGAMGEPGNTPFADYSGQDLPDGYAGVYSVFLSIRKAEKINVDGGHIDDIKVSALSSQARDDVSSYFKRHRWDWPRETLNTLQLGAWIDESSSKDVPRVQIFFKVGVESPTSHEADINCGSTHAPHITNAMDELGQAARLHRALRGGITKSGCH